MIFNLSKPLETEGKTSLEILRAAKKQGAHVVARTPFAWDLPVWLASGELDAIDVIHHHALRDAVVDNEKEGRPRDKTFFPGRNGNGRWSEAIYYHVLNCGLRIPPAAGSGSGTNRESARHQPRVRVLRRRFLARRVVGGRRGGPRVRHQWAAAAADGRRPAAWVRVSSARADRWKFEIGLNLATRVPVDVPADHQGRPRRARSAARRVRGARRQVAAGGVRRERLVPGAGGDQQHKNYQFAESGPYYVEQRRQARVSRASVEFFLDWIAEAEARIRELQDIEEPLRESMLAEQASGASVLRGPAGDGERRVMAAFAWRTEQARPLIVCEMPKYR